MKAGTVETLVWVLLYGGLLLAVLGLAMLRADHPLGWSMVVAGGMAAGVGVALIWIRSKMD
jgi:hypothetical protein